MRFLHISDLHIGCKLYNRDLSEDIGYVLDQVVRAAVLYKPEVLIIAGDVYDKAIPSQEAVEQFDSFMASLAREAPGMDVMVISGNHDSPVRLPCYGRLLKKQGVYMAGLAPTGEEEHLLQVEKEDAYGKVVFTLLPFVKPSQARQLLGEESLSYDETVRRLLEREVISPQVRNVLISHQFYLPRGTAPEEVERAGSEICTVGNIDQVFSDVLEPFDYAALGHIHKPMKVGQERFRYCGTPLPLSLSEAGQEKAMLLVELGEKGTPAQIKSLPFQLLRQVRRIQGSVEEVLSQSTCDYVALTLKEKEWASPEGELYFDLEEKLRRAFPNLLEVRRQWEVAPDYAAASGAGPIRLDPFALCQELFPDLSEDEKKVLFDVIQTVESVL